MFSSEALLLTPIALMKGSESSEVGVEAGADVIAVEDDGEAALLMEDTLCGVGDGGFPRAGEAAHPDGEAFLFEEGFFVVAVEETVVLGVDVIHRETLTFKLQTTRMRNSERELREEGFEVVEVVADDRVKDRHLEILIAMDGDVPEAYHIPHGGSDARANDGVFRKQIEGFATALGNSIFPAANAMHSNVNRGLPRSEHVQAD